MATSKRSETKSATDEKAEVVYCLNCDERLTGLYCAECGQKDIGKRLDSRLMIHNLFESLTDLNSKPWRTLIELVKNPGRVAYAYIQGARSSYINPIRFMITTYAIYIGFLAANGWLGAEVTTGDTVNVTLDSGQEFKVEAGEGEETSEEYQAIQEMLVEIKNIFAQQRDLLTFLLVPIYSFVLRWVFFKSRYNFAETLTFTCYMLGQIQIYAFLVALVPFIANSVEYEGTPGFIPFIVFWMSIAGFYKKKRLKTFFMTVLAYMIYSLANGAVAFGLAMIALHYD